MDTVASRWRCILCLVCFYASVLECVNYSNVAEYNLYNALFAEYNFQMRPRSNCANTINVSVEYELNSVAGLDEVDQVLSTVGFIVTIWYDEFLVWTPASYENIEHLVVYANKVWLPDIGIKNSATKFFDPSYKDDIRVDIRYDGRVIWKFGGHFSTSCTLDMTYYPFDLQSCHIEIENWVYTNNLVNLYNAIADVHLQEFSENGEWKLDHTKCESSTYAEDTHPGKLYPRVQCTIYLSRKFQYYLINIILPAMFVISISLMVFWLPPDSGEKVSLGVTVLLAFSVFQLVIMEYTPRSSDYTPVLTLIFTIIMGEATFSVLTSILVLFYHHHGAQSRPPKAVRFVAFDMLGKLFCMKNQIPKKNQVDTESKTDVSGSSEKLFHEVRNKNITKELDEKIKQKIVFLDKNDSADDLKEILSYIRHFHHTLEDQGKDHLIKDEWKCLAKIIDRTFFWISFTVTIIVIPVFLFRRDYTH